MQKLMGDEGWGGGLFSLLTPSVCGSESRPSYQGGNLSLCGLWALSLCGLDPKYNDSVYQRLNVPTGSPVLVTIAEYSVDFQSHEN